MSASRLSKKSRKLRGVDMSQMSQPCRLDIWTIPTMAEAASAVEGSERYMPNRDEFKRDWKAAGALEGVNGDPTRLATAMDGAQDLVADAIRADPRLARRSQWARAEEGEVVCAALLSQGDDAPCFHRKRSLVAQPNGADPVKIVISTDSNAITPGTAAAFIAACQIVQQYRPIEVWWQGSWLNENHSAGWVFHVPLVQGDVDFSRMDFCIQSRHRDSLSWSVMMVRACDETKAVWNGCNQSAERSYLPGAMFVSHHGVNPTGDSVAAAAAQWLGWDDVWTDRWKAKNADAAALMSLPAIEPGSNTITAEDRARWAISDAKFKAESEAKDRAAAAARTKALTGLNRNY